MADDDNAKPQPEQNPQDSETKPAGRPPPDPDLSDYHKRDQFPPNVEKKSGGKNNRD